jgi:hypothetical protein
MNLHHRPDGRKVPPLAVIDPEPMQEAVIKMARLPTEQFSPSYCMADTDYSKVNHIEAVARPTGFEPMASAFGGQRRGPTAGCAISLTSCPDSEERTGIRFEKERVYGYYGGAKALPGRPLAPAIAPIRGSRR